MEPGSLDLEISGSEAAGYAVRVIGPAGERARAPFDVAALADLGPDLETIRQGLPDRATMERVGSTLFQILFPRDVMLVYASARAQVREAQGLRLRLHLPPKFANLPWELLYDAPNYLSTDPRSPVVRFLDLPDAPSPLVMPFPLRLLHVIARPVDSPALGVEAEAEHLRSALAELVEAGKVEIVEPACGTLDALRDGLRRGCHILHFSGHGGFSGQEGFLLFEDDEKYGVPVSSDTLAQLLRGTGVRLALLNACESAQAGTGDAFSSVAGALVRAGLPAVIACQYAMPDTSAIRFAAEFYRALAAGFAVDAAVTDGRKAILSAPGVDWRSRLDWAIPVLIMQVSDGRVFAMEEARRQTRAAAGQRTYVAQQITTVDIGTIHGGQFDFGMNLGGAPPPDQAPAGDLLPALLDELRDKVRDRAPREKRAEALEKVAALRGAATEKRPNLALVEAIWKWFDAEIPELSGAVLSAILGFKPALQALGDEMVWDFEDRFEAP